MSERRALRVTSLAPCVRSPPRLPRDQRRVLRAVVAPATLRAAGAFAVLPATLAVRGAAAFGALLATALFATALFATAVLTPAVAAVALVRRAVGVVLVAGAREVAGLAFTAPRAAA